MPDVDPEVPSILVLGAAGPMAWPRVFVSVDEGPPVSIIYTGTAALATVYPTLQAALAARRRLGDLSQSVKVRKRF